MLINYIFRDWSISVELPNFYSIVYSLLKKIPKNKITTYGEIARGLGDIRAARAIGRLMAKNIWYKEIPCYKVVHSDSRIGKYSGPGGVDTKKALLEKEKITIKGDRVINLEKYLWTSKDMDIFPYLKSLKRIQEYLSSFTLKSIESENYVSYRNIVACDVSYLDHIPDLAVSSCVLFSEKKLINITLSILPVFFPYIPGYLAFREIIPLSYSLLPILKNSNLNDYCILVDGHGILHPRRFGIASHLGLLLGTPTIGIAKKLLIGKALRNRFDKRGDKIYYPVIYEGRVLGYCIEKNRSKIYVSPGAYISIDNALDMALSLSWRNRKGPDIMILPHIISNYFRKTINNLCRMRSHEK